MMKNRQIFAAIAVFWVAVSTVFAADFAWELRCEQQYTTAELPDLIWSQGSTPLISARVYERGKAVPPAADVSVRMMIAPTATSQWWAVVTNQTTNATGYLLQWPTVGTNTTASAPWYYTVYFLRNGHLYWTGRGNLWIEETTSTADGLVWQDISSTGFEKLREDLDALTAKEAADVLGLSTDIATNAAAIAELEEELDGRISSLWGECAGGYRWPDYFHVQDVIAGVLPWTITNTATATRAVYNVNVETVEESSLKGWLIESEIIRQHNWSTGVVWEAVRGKRVRPDGQGNPMLYFSIDPDDLAIDGDVVHFAEGVETVDSDFAVVRGALGDFTVRTVLEFDAAKQTTASTVYRFGGPADGSLLAACWSNVMVTASNGAASGKGVHLRTWPEGYGSSTNHVPATWNTNFWGWSLGDFSCVSYHSDAKPGFDGGVYRPITMITPRHGIGANHYLPMTGSNCYWVTRGGTVATNRIIARKNIRGDLTVVRLEHAFDTNDILPAKLLGSGWHSYLYGDTNYLHGRFEVPVVAFDCAERGYLMRWTPYSMLYGRSEMGSHDDDLAGTTIYVDESKDPFAGVVPFYRRKAVGGDSGSPVFWPVDGRTVLLWCFHHPGGGPLPTKMEVDEAIAAWGDDERCEDYDLSKGGWNNPDMPGPPGQ